MSKPMRVRGWQIAGVLLLNAVLTCRAENATAIKEFGIERSRPLNGAFFFWNYQYVEAPYIVERRGLDVFINGRLVRPGPSWPQEKIEVPPDPGDPPPNWAPVTDQKEYLFTKWMYLSGNHDVKTARRMMIELFRKCPRIKTVNEQPDDEDAVILTDANGDELPLLLNTWWMKAPPSKEQVIARAREAAGTLARMFRRNVFEWMGDREYPEVGMPASTGLRVLEIVFSNMAESEKTKRLTDEGLDMTPENVARVKEWPTNTQLRARFEKLKNGEVEEEPPEPPAWVAEAQTKSRQGDAPAEKATSGDPETPPRDAPASGFPIYAWLASGLAFLAVVLILLSRRFAKR